MLAAFGGCFLQWPVGPEVLIASFLCLSGSLQPAAAQGLLVPSKIPAAGAQGLEDVSQVVCHPVPGLGQESFRTSLLLLLPQVPPCA